jgi:hypothetical protein
MTPTTWRLTLHITDGQLVTYALSRATWDGPVKRGLGIEIVSSCRPEELHRVLDAVADHLLHEPPLGQEKLL